MSAKSIARSNCSVSRVGLALLLTILLLFPDGLAAQACKSTPWTTSNSMLPAPIETLNAVVNNGYLYVVGGYTAGSGTFQNTVSYTKLSSTDGSLGVFNPTTAQLPIGLSRDLCGVVYKGNLYTVGGVEYSSSNPFGMTTTAVRHGKTSISTGDIVSWGTPPDALNEAVQLHGTVAMTIGTTGFMYVIGGSLGTDSSQSQTTSNITNHVWYARINSNGSVGTFNQTTDLPIKLYKTCPVVIGNTIYVAGGETNNPTHPAVGTVYYATPNSDGSISSWPQATSLPNNSTLASQAVAYVNTKGIVLMGGDSTGTGGDTTEVFKGVVTGIGNVTWSSTSLPMLTGPAPYLGNVSRNAGATFNHYAYSVAGLVRGHDSPAVNCLLVP